MKDPHNPGAQFRGHLTKKEEKMPIQSKRHHRETIVFKARRTCVLEFTNRKFFGTTYHEMHQGQNELPVHLRHGSTMYYVYTMGEITRALAHLRSQSDPGGPIVVPRPAPPRHGKKRMLMLSLSRSQPDGPIVVP